MVLYVDIRRGPAHLGGWKKENNRAGFRINKGCKGRGDWIGEIVFKAKDSSDEQRKNIGKVIA